MGEEDEMPNNGELFERPITIWDIGRQWIGGDLLGKSIRDHGDDKVKAAIVDTLLRIPADPKTYLLGLLKGQSTDRPLWKWTPEELYAAAQERDIPTIGKSRRELVSALEGLV